MNADSNDIMIEASHAIEEAATSRLFFEIESREKAILKFQDELNKIRTEIQVLKHALKIIGAELCSNEADDGVYEYRVTEGQRKAWDGKPDLSVEGWEEYKPWERFEFTEERYWRRKK